jgi:hypothetical protein
VPAGVSAPEAVERHLNSFSVKINDSRRKKKNKNPWSVSWKLTGRDVTEESQ